MMTYDTFLQTVRKYTRGIIDYQELAQIVLETRRSGDLPDRLIVEAFRWGNNVDALVNPISDETFHLFDMPEHTDCDVDGNVYTPMSFIREYNALVAEYAKLEERARVAQVERISILLKATSLNDRHDALSAAQRTNDFSLDFCNMITLLGHTDSDFDGNVKALQRSYNPLT